MKRLSALVAVVAGVGCTSGDGRNMAPGHAGSLDASGSSSDRSPAADADSPSDRSTPAPDGGFWGTFELIGFVPGVGTPYDVVVDWTKNLAFVASKEFGLSVVNVANPKAPVTIGAANVPFLGQRVALFENLAVVGSGTGLTVVDIATPKAPRTIGLLGANVVAVAISGPTAYALLVVPGNPSHVDLAVVSLRTPASPTIVGRVTVGVAGNDLRLLGSLAYVAAGTDGLKVISVAAATNPMVIGTANTPGIARSLALSGSYAYVADDTSVQVINVATPSAPVAAGSLATSVSAVAFGTGRLYAVDGLSLKVIDVTKATTPSLLSSTNGLGATRLDARDTNVILASANISSTQGGLYLWDATTATAPTVTSRIYDLFDSTGLAVSGELGVAAGSSYGIRVVDLSSPAAPRVVGALPGNVRDVALSGQTAYALLLVPGNPGHVDLATVSLATPSAPTIVGSLTLGISGSDIELDGTTAYVAGGADGLHIVNVAPTTSPTLVKSIDTPGIATGVAVAGRQAYVADTTNVHVIDVSTPSRAVLVGSLATSASALAVAGGRLYLVDGRQLKIVDVTNPRMPVLLTATGGYGAQAIAVADHTAYLATPGPNSDPNSGLRAIDVSNPMSLGAAQRLVIPGFTRSLAVGALHLYAGDSNAIIDVIGLAP